MIQLLHRDPSSKSGDSADQARRFAGRALPPGARTYSKPGWTSSTRHDAAYIRLPNGAEYILTVCTVDNSSQVDIIPFVSQLVAEAFAHTPVQADLVLTNGRIWTGDTAHPWAEALAARGERLIAVGSNDDIKKLAGAQTRIIDLQGKLALPGFIDDHTHFI